MGIIASGVRAASAGRGWALPAALAVGLALTLKAALLAAQAFPFNADEAVVALMARHMLAGARPAFFYGQAYMGSLDAALVALGFAAFGQQVWVIRLLQSLLYAGTVASTAALAGRMLGGARPALVAGLLMAVPAVNVTLYTTVSLGGYGEALLIGNLLMLLALQIRQQPRERWRYALWGALAGLGFWGFALTLVYALPSGWMVLRAAARGLRPGEAGPRLALLVLMALTGAAPWIAWALRHGLGLLIAEAGGSAIAGASPTGLLPRAAAHTLNLLLFGTTAVWGLRPPWEIRWLAWPLLPAALVFWLGVTAHTLRRLWAADSIRRGLWLPAASAGLLMAGFILTPFGADPSGRYFLPLAPAGALFAAHALESVWRRDLRTLAAAAVAAVVAFNLWGTVECARRNPPGFTTQFDASTRIDRRHDQALIDFLQARGERRGYTTYWVSYPLAFLSGEDLVFVSRLPYHHDLRYTPRDDRYAPYGQAVEASARVAYILAGEHPLQARLRQALDAAGVAFAETTIGDYHVFHDLGRRVTPDELNLLP